MAEQPLVYPPLSDDLQRGLSLRSLKYFGAGAIMASVTIGSGETLFASRSGALFGYTLLWCFAAGAIMKGMQMYSATRYFVLTGVHPMTHWGLLPGPKNWVPITMAALCLICFPFWQAGLPLMLGTIVNWIFGIAGTRQELQLYTCIWATIAVFASVTLVWLESYAFLEKAQVLIVGLLLGCLLAAAVSARPDWMAALMGLVTPTVPDYAPWIAQKYPSIVTTSPWVETMTCLGAVGGGTYDYIGCVGFLREKGWGAIGSRHGAHDTTLRPDEVPLAIDVSSENIRRAKRWLMPTQIDNAIGFSCVLVFTTCFIILGAHFLHPREIVPANDELFNHQAQFLTELHPALLYLYQLGIFTAFFGTIYGAYEIYARSAYECLLPISAWVREMPFEKFRRGMVLYCAAGGLILLWTLTLWADANPDNIVRPAAIIGGVFANGLWCLAMLWTDRHFLPKQLQMPPALRGLVTVSGVVLTVLGVSAIWQYVAGLLANLSG
jgi:Mn2+/Fe2+ NRAMP family transporter